MGPSFLTNNESSMFKISSFFSSLTWTVPFLLFFLGYYGMHHCMNQKTYPAPHVIGMSLSAAIKKLSHYHINAQVVLEKEDLTLAPETVIAQNPSPGKTIKPHQTFFLIITKQNKQKECADMRDLPLETVQKQCASMHIMPTLIGCHDVHPQGICLAHFPSAGTVLKTETPFLVYHATLPSQLVIMPDFTHQLACDVILFLKNQNIKINSIHSAQQREDHFCTRCTVIQQRPVAGSFVDLSQLTTVSLHLQAH